jgi:hypothetical protein
MHTIQTAIDNAPRAIATGRVFQLLRFDASHAPHINYDSIARTAREIGGGFAVTYAQDGAATVTIYWED